MVKKQRKGQERLTLSKETIRQLETPELMAAAGGGSFEASCYSGCNGTGYCCAWK